MNIGLIILLVMAIVYYSVESGNIDFLKYLALGLVAFLGFKKGHKAVSKDEEDCFGVEYLKDHEECDDCPKAKECEKETR